MLKSSTISVRAAAVGVAAGRQQRRRGCIAEGCEHKQSIRKKTRKSNQGSQSWVRERRAEPLCSLPEIVRQRWLIVRKVLRSVLTCADALHGDTGRVLAAAAGQNARDE